MSSILALIYGQPGIGKTTFAISSPSPIVFDFDRGYNRIDPMHAIGVEYRLNTDYKGLLSFLDSNEVELYETIVIDTLGRLLDSMTVYICKSNPRVEKVGGGLTLQGFGVLKNEFESLTRKIMSLGKNVVFVDHEAESKHEDVTVKRPSSQASRVNELVKDMSLVGYMEARGTRRTISFSPTEKHYAKNSAFLEPSIEIPLADNGNMYLSELFQVISERKSDKKNTAIELGGQIDSYSSVFIGKKTVDELNNVMEDLRSKELHIFVMKSILVKMKQYALPLGIRWSDKKKEWYSV